VKVAGLPAVTEAGPERDGTTGVTVSVCVAHAPPVEASWQRTSTLGTQITGAVKVHVAVPNESALRGKPVGACAATTSKLVQWSAPTAPRLQVAATVVPAETDVRSSERLAVVRFQVQELSWQLWPDGHESHVRVGSSGGTEGSTGGTHHSLAASLQSICSRKLQPNPNTTSNASTPFNRRASHITIRDRQG